jgi:hypothetical protein
LQWLGLREEPPPRRRVQILTVAVFVPALLTGSYFFGSVGLAAGGAVAAVVMGAIRWNEP